MEPYVLFVRASGHIHVSALARLRSEVALLILKLVDTRTLQLIIVNVPSLQVPVEDVEHVLMSCPKYNTARDDLFKHAVYCHPDFFSLNITDTCIFLM